MTQDDLNIGTIPTDRGHAALYATTNAFFGKMHLIRRNEIKLDGAWSVQTITEFRTR